MDRVAAANYVTNSGKRQFADKNLGTNTPGTSLAAQWHTGIQESVILPAEGFGLVPSHGDDTQLLTALRMASANFQRSITASATLVAADAGMVSVSAAAGSVVLTLPGANAANGKPLTMILARTDTTANTVTVSRAGGDVIWPHAQTSVPLPPLGVMVLRSDGSGTWYTVDAPQRRRLLGDLTIYVSASGSDTNSGMSVGSPLATLNAAWAMIVRTLDLNGYAVTVSVADGTYGPLLGAGVVLGALDGTKVQFVGNTTTPANCVISASNASAIVADNGAQFTVNGFEVTSTGASPGQGVGVFSRSSGALIRVGAAMRFGANTFAHMGSAAAGHLVALPGYTIAGASDVAWSAGSGGVFEQLSGAVNIAGTPAFASGFVFAREAGVVICPGVTFPGTGATGQRYRIDSNGVVYTNGGGANYLPGNAAGATTTGGQYV